MTQNRNASLPLPQLIAFAVCCLLSTPAKAQEEPNIWIEKAQSLVNQASRSFANGDYEVALESLKKAEELAERARDPSLASIRFNIARCHEELGQFEEALAAYERYDKMPDKPYRKEKAFKSMQALKKRVQGLLLVDCQGMAVSLSIPGVTDNAACPFQSERIEAGTYTVSATGPGFVPTTKSVVVQAGETARVQLRPTRTNAVEVAAPEPEASGGNPLPWIAMGTGVVVAGAGGVFTALAADARSEAEELPPGSERDGKVSDFDTFRATSIAAYSAGGVLAVGGLIWFLLEQNQSNDDNELTVLPAIDGISVKF